MNSGRHGSRVALLDWEPQGSLTFWWTRRGKPENPQLIAGAPDPVETAEKIANDFDFCSSTRHLVALIQSSVQLALPTSC